MKSSFDRPYIALKCGLEWSFAGDSFFAINGHQYSLANPNGDVQRMVLGSLMFAPLPLATVKMAQSRVDVARSSVDGLHSTLRRTQHFLPLFDSGRIEMGNVSGFLRTVRDWPF